MKYINKITISFNFICLLVLISYFYIDIRDDQKILKLKKEKVIITNSLDPIKYLTNVDIEIIELPEVQQISNNNLKVKTGKSLLPIKHENESLPNDFKLLSPSKLSNNKSYNIPKIIPIKYKNNSFKIHKKSASILTKSFKFTKEPIKLEKKLNIKNFINLGTKALKNTKIFQLEFLWPLNTIYHDKIYKILDECLQSKTVLMDDNNIIYGLNGEIKRHTLKSEFSEIIRVPTYVHSNFEKNKINHIQNKFLSNFPGKHLRLYKKNIDAYIVGFYFNLAQKNKIKIKNIKKIKGNYRIIDNKLYLDNLIINSFHFNDKILLSSLNKTCTI